MGIYVRHLSSLEHDPREHVAAHPDTPERIVAIEHEMASLDWLGFDVLDAPVVTDAALERVRSKAHVEVIRKLAAAGGGPIGEDTFVGESSSRAALHASLTTWRSPQRPRSLSTGWSACLYSTGTSITAMERRRSSAAAPTCYSRASIQTGAYPATGLLTDTGSGPGEGHTINLPVYGVGGRALALAARVSHRARGAGLQTAAGTHLRGL
jgi:acetoin utilization deacetylase AcuC-like enzyme